MTYWIDDLLKKQKNLQNVEFTSQFPQPIPSSPFGKPQEQMRGREVPPWERQPLIPPWAPDLPQLTPQQQRVTPPPIVPQPVVSPPPKVEERVTLPFWQRALQVFTAPFEWIDEYVIKPGLSVAATAAGAVPEVKRMPGEDFFEWKKRAWAEWGAPGIDINVPWSDDPWRVDIKGVAELAPWLLIPGAGQVGGGIRAARGLAGIASKFGKAGKTLGYAIEYSPWGLVEKTAGVALKAGFKGLGKVTSGVSAKIGERIFGKIPEPEIPPVILKLNQFFDESVIPARKAFEKELPALRERQIKAVDEIWGRVRRGEITATKGTELVEKATAGGIKKGFAVEVGKFTNDEVEDMLGMIAKSAENGFVQRDSAVALRDLLMTGVLPEPHNIRDFARVFGEAFAKSAGKFARLPVSIKDQLIDLANLPRSVLASGDLSATFRQGLILLLTHPEKAPRAFARQLKGFASEKLSLQMDDALRSHPLYNGAVRDGVEFTALRKGAQLVAKEEIFASNLATRLPFVRRSERAFTTFLNEMRMGAYEAAHGAMLAQGASATEMKLMGRFINLASGRGDLPANLNRYAPVLNTVLFSARYQMSTLQLPRQLGRMLLSKNPYMRKEAAKALITFVGGGASLLGLLKATGTGEVELDPRSGDFGKVIIGDTRLDIWRGYIQYARFVAQLLTGERKSSYGNMNKVQRSEIVSRFIQSKSSPAFGLMVDLLKGESYMGEPLFNETTGFIKTARDRLLPLAMQDVMDAMEQSGTNGIWTAAPATLGIGVLTYVNDLVRVKEKIARNMGYGNWDDIDPKTQREIENSNTELQVAYIDFDRQVMGTAWGDWRNAGKAIDDVFRENVDNAVAQYHQTGDGYNFREKIGKAYDERRGAYKTRDKEERFSDIVRRLKTEDPAEAMITLGPEQLAIKMYNDALYGDDMQDEFGDYRFDEARVRKEQLRSQLGEEMFNYVEDYAGLKYDDMPPEFLELIKAKEALRPYWEVKENVIRQRGEPRTPHQIKAIDRRVSRMRKFLRLLNPEMNRYYEMFYSQSKGK